MPFNNQVDRTCKHIFFNTAQYVKYKQQDKAIEVCDVMFLFLDRKLSLKGIFFSHFVLSQVAVLMLYLCKRKQHSSTGVLPVSLHLVVNSISLVIPALSL